MYIELNAIYFVLAIIGCVALVYLIVVLKNLNKIINESRKILLNNSRSINDSLEKLPKVISNINEAGENIKDVTEVVTDVTADIIVAKDNMKSNFEIGSEILAILRSVFGK